MIDPNSITFQETDADGQVVLVGQIALTEGLTIDAAKLAGSDVPRAVLIAQAKQALLVQLWYLAYGELGGYIEAIHQHARETGSLRTLAWTRAARQLLRPEVRTPAPEEDLTQSRRDAEPLMNGTTLILSERWRQHQEEGWTAEHDDGHECGELVLAALGYARTAAIQADPHPSPSALPMAVPDEWPWGDADWKPSGDPIRNLVKAGALIAAEIDRLQRQALQTQES